MDSRYSNVLLSQEYKYSIKNVPVTPTGNVSAASSSHSDTIEKVICFQRNEVIFNNKKSILINIRDMTNQEGLYEAKQTNKQIHRAINRLAKEIEDSLQSTCAKIQKSNNKKDNPAAGIEIADFFSQAKYWAIKVRNLRDFSSQGSSEFAPKLEEFDVKHTTD